MSGFNSTKYEIKRGQALVITGPQGCGKTTLARKIAAHHGTFAEIDAHEFLTNFGLGNALANEPNTLIVDGMVDTVEILSKVKAALTSEMIICHRKYQESKSMNSPNFIICSGDENALHLSDHDRRFSVIRLGDHENKMGGQEA